MNRIQIKVARADGLPGFAAYLAETLSSLGKTTIDLDPNQALVLLDVEAIFDDEAVVSEDGSPIPPSTPQERRRHMIQTLMHEFGHVLEEFFGQEFDEDWIENVVQSWRDRSEQGRVLIIHNSDT